ncbi:MAG: glycosyltransferase family 2 protein [Ignavibacteria bacterium]|nr:glycosyltransferase family 2 protein [Ignavibacteria bacterium]
MKASIIILNYNGKEFLKDCINSVLSQSYNDFEAILFDNNSSDGSPDFVKENFRDERIKVIISEKNLGFAGGNNKAYESTQGELIVLLNNDTVVEKDWLSELVKTVTADEETGMAQSLVITEGIPLKYYEKNGTINLFGHNIMGVFDIGTDGIGEIFQANGCSLIVRRKILDETGGLFPDEFFAYAEDSHLSFKVIFAGYKILHTSKSVVRHKGGATMKKYKNEMVTFYQERNRILNFLIFFSRSFRRKYFLLLWMNIKIKILYSLFTGKYSFKGIVKAYIWIYKNRKWIEAKRNELEKIKKVNESSVIAMLSGRYANGYNIIEKYFNFISLTYLKLVKIKTRELI